MEPEPIVINGETYYYADGKWYQKVVYDGKTQYMVVAAPSGYETKDLPGEPEMVEYEGQTYYYVNGIFYIQITRGGDPDAKW